MNITFLVELLSPSLRSFSIVFACVLCSCAVHAREHARESGNATETLRITIRNDTRHFFTFSHAEKYREGDHVWFEGDRLLPGEHADVVVEKNVRGTLHGTVVFVDENNNNLSLTMAVREQRHFGSPLFIVSSQKYQRSINSLTINPIIGPRLLTHVHVDMRILAVN